MGGGGSPGHRRRVFFFQAEDGIRDVAVTGVQTCALPIWMKVRAQGKATEMSGQLRQSQLVQGDPVPRRWPLAAAAAGVVLVGSVLVRRRRRSEERRVGKSVDLGGRRIIKKKKRACCTLRV